MTKSVTAMVSRGKNRVQITLDNQARFSLSKTIAKEVQLGEQLTETQVQELIARDLERTAYEQALRLLAHRPRTEQELRQRYAKKGLAGQVQDAAVERLKSEGLVDDAAFAKTWIDNRMEFRPRAAWALRSELRSKGVSQELIENALQDFDESEAARRAAMDGARRYQHLSPELFRRRFSAYLSRRGFTYPTISPLIVQHMPGNEAESEDSH